MKTRTGKFAIAVTIFVIVAIFAIPNLLSTTYVKQRIADQLSQLTGRQVSLEGSSSISLRPYLGVSYDNVVISDEADPADKPLIVIDEFKAKLGIFAALFGDAELAEVEFIRPHFQLTIDQSGIRNWSPNKGQIGVSIADEEAKHTLDLGRVRIEDGILELTDERNRQHTKFTAINGQLSWPDSNSSANIQLSSVWRGEIVNLSASVARPMQWLRDGKSEISVKLDSNPLSLSFDGIYDSTTEQFDGSLAVDSPSSTRLSDWVGWQLQAPKKFGSFSISGDVKYQNQSLEFPDATVSLEKHQGTGRLQMMLKGNDLLAVNGTLAFATVELPDLRNLLQSQPNGSTGEAGIDLSFLDGLALDVRLSAETATGAPFAMTNLAAAIIINDGRASFDIGQADAIGGALSGSITLQAQDGATAVSADLVGKNIELEQLTQVYADESVSLQGSGDFEIKLKSVGNTFDDMLLRLNGEGLISGEDGTLNGLDLPELYQSTLAGSGSVARVSSGKTGYQTINLGYFIANGTAFMRDSFLKTESVNVDIRGRIDLVRRTIALRGQIQNAAAQENEATKLPFFVGGTASSPLFVPLPNAIRPQAEAPQQEKSVQD